MPLTICGVLVNPRDVPPLVRNFDVPSAPLFALFVEGDHVARIRVGFVSGDDLDSRGIEPGSVIVPLQWMRPDTLACHQ